MAESEYGLNVARSLQARLADMLSAANVDELLVGNPRLSDVHQLTYKIDLAEAYTLFFESNHQRHNGAELVTVDWSQVSRIKLMRIERQDV